MESPIDSPLQAGLGAGEGLAAAGTHTILNSGFHYTRDANGQIVCTPVIASTAIGQSQAVAGAGGGATPTPTGTDPDLDFPLVTMAVEKVK